MADIKAGSKHLIGTIKKLYKRELTAFRLRTEHAHDLLNTK
jgi:hypothetical protein